MQRRRAKVLLAPPVNAPPTISLYKVNYVNFTTFDIYLLKYSIPDEHSYMPFAFTVVETASWDRAQVLDKEKHCAFIL